MSNSGDSPAAIEYGSVILAPQDPEEWPRWRAELTEWREKTREAIQYDDTLYRRPDFAWVSSCYTWHHTMLWDLAFVDAERACFKVESFLDYGLKEFGGYDMLILWPDYPRMGIDDRNQFDHYRAVPGGLEGLRAVVEACHARGVKVFVAFKPWDTDTRREGVSEVDANVALVEEIDADGMFLDTMSSAREAHRDKLDAARPGVAFAPENAYKLDVSAVQQHHMELHGRLAPWTEDCKVPGVLRNKWFERRHQHFVWGSRTASDHSALLHLAWMNGAGVFVWDNAFAVQVPWSPRDRSILRAMLPIQRRYTHLFSGEGWVPLVQTLAGDVYASLWEGEGLRLWTLVNACEREVRGVLLQVPHIHGVRYFDLIAGREVEVRVQEGSAALRGVIRPRGIGAFIAVPEERLDADFFDFVAQQATIDARADFRLAVPKPKEILRPVVSSRRYSKGEIPEGMAMIPATSYEMEVQFRIRECLLYQAPELEDFEFVFSNYHKPAFLSRNVTLSPYAIDLAPVTNAQFAEFLRLTAYQPKHPENFLAHWRDGVPPAGKEDHPVVYVDLRDARAYARWAGKRLPTEEEWQYAAEGPEALVYPWGNEMVAGMCNDGTGGDTTPVKAYPDGRSPFGCYDMCGNVWELTESERTDGRTHFCILKGGSYYRITGSYWYADGGPQPCNFAGKYILFWSGLDRSPTIGFRCVVDLTAD